jgi:hypothetical protein
VTAHWRGPSCTRYALGEGPDIQGWLARRAHILSSVLKGGGVASWASVLTVMALAGGAAGWSAATSPSIPNWAAIPINNPSAISSLHQAVDATINARSFTMTGSFYGPGSGFGVFGFSSDQPPTLNHNTFRLVFQAPDRFDLIESNPKQEVISIGTTVYTRAIGSSIWTTPGTGSLGTLDANEGLLLLLYGSVQQWHNIYHVTYGSIPRVATNQHALYERYAYTATVQDGKVVSLDGMTTAFAQGFPSVLSEQTDVTYSAFGTSPPVTAPPASDISV